MTIADVLRELAAKTEECDGLKREIEALQKETVRLQKELAKKTAPEWLSVLEAALYIGRSRSFLDKDRIAAKPQIPFKQECENGNVKYSRADLDRWNARHMRGQMKIAA